MPLLTVPAHDIDAAGLSLSAALPLPWLADELEGTGVTGTEPGAVTARLSRSGKEIVVRGRIQAKLTLPCARCLAPTPFEVDTELTLLLHPVAPKLGAARAAPAKGKAAAEAPKAAVPKAAASKAAPPKGKGRAAKEEEYEFSSAEADVDAYDGDTVVLDPFVREAILLEVPNFPLCSEACPGIGAVPASPAEANGGADPRFAALGALRAKLAGAEAQAAPDPRKKKKE
jgi:uncharacterized protein